MVLKVIFMAKETFSSKCALEYLCSTNSRVAVVAAVIREGDASLKKLCEDNSIKILTEKDLKRYRGEEGLEVDYILSFYWKKLSKDIIDIPRKGSINFHPGPLPEARGSGYHMAIIENWGYWGVTAHYMDEEFDTGAIIECRRFTIGDGVVNKDLVETAHKQLFLLFKDIMDKLFDGEELSGEIQREGRYFSLKELERNKLICEDESIESIEKKIRAFWNPPYSGAQIEIKGKRYTVINEHILSWIADRIKNSEV